MAWYDDPTHPFAGIAEKLKRADQNIVNLDSEIKSFIEGGKYPVIPKPDAEEWQEALDYHKGKSIPPRFAVLAGEVIHHLRSCLDHVVWYFSDGESRKKPGSIEFPVFKVEPTDEKEIARYQRKVKGIKNANVLRLIEDMQPYKVGADAANHAFLIIHDMDRFDKHQELVIVDSGLQIAFPINALDLRRKAHLYTQGKLPVAEHIELAFAIQDYGISPSISFREFGEYRPYSVIKGLSLLFITVSEAIWEFAAEI